MLSHRQVLAAARAMPAVARADTARVLKFIPQSDVSLTGMLDGFPVFGGNKRA